MFFFQTTLKEHLQAPEVKVGEPQSQDAENDVQAKLDKSREAYVAVLEDIADTLKALDSDLLQNVLGKEYEPYMKRQIERYKVSPGVFFCRSSGHFFSILADKWFQIYVHSFLL